MFSEVTSAVILRNPRVEKQPFFFSNNLSFFFFFLHFLGSNSMAHFTFSQSFRWFQVKRKIWAAPLKNDVRAYKRRGLRQDTLGVITDVELLNLYQALEYSTISSCNISQDPQQENSVTCCMGPKHKGSSKRWRRWGPQLMADTAYITVPQMQP